MYENILIIISFIIIYLHNYYSKESNLCRLECKILNTFRNDKVKKFVNKMTFNIRMKSYLLHIGVFIGLVGLLMK